MVHYWINERESLYNYIKGSCGSETLGNHYSEDKENLRNKIKSEKLWRCITTIYLSV